MGSSEKKQLKDKAKIEKKREKAKLKAQKKADKARAEAGGGQAEKEGAGEAQSSAAVRFAETVRGILYLILSVSMAVAVLLSNQGYIMTLEDIFESLVLAWVGKFILVVIAAALFIYGLKRLRAIR